jgi:hypothetical protein
MEQLLIEHKASCRACRKGRSCADKDNLVIALSIELLDSTFPWAR